MLLTGKDCCKLYLCDIQEQQRIKAMEIARVQDEEKRAKAAAALKLKRQSTSRYNSSANISADLNGTLTSAHPDSYV